MRMKEKLQSRSATVALGLLFMLFSQVAWSQHAISGKITDENGQGIPGVNVIVEGSSNGTTTDAEGTYRLTVAAEGDALVF